MLISWNFGRKQNMTALSPGDVYKRQLLDGERSQTMNKEMKETLDKVADVYKRQLLH